VQSYPGTEKQTGKVFTLIAKFFICGISKEKDVLMLLIHPLNAITALTFVKNV
jgi:hypothetical protein